MTEPDVTLTDYALALECGLITALLARRPGIPSALRRSWMVVFATVGLGSLIGGTVHGFFREQGQPGYAALWSATLLAIGATSVAMWFVGSYATLSAEKGRPLRMAALVVGLAYAAVVWKVSQRFVIAIAMYLPATLFLLAVFMAAYVRDPRRPTGLRLGVAALLLTFIAAAVQQAHLAIHPVYFNHNALYHLIQGIALALLYFGAGALPVAQPVAADRELEPRGTPS